MGINYLYHEHVFPIAFHSAIVLSTPEQLLMFI